MLRHAVEPMFIHEYTLTPTNLIVDDPSTPSTDESQDPWGDSTTTPGTPLPNLPCQYMEQSVIEVSPSGPVEINRAVLLVPDIDLARPGDHAANVRTVADVSKNIPSIVLMLGPVRIEDVHVVAAMSGGTVYKEVVLRQVAQVLG
jgi:hypothetical protein